MHLIDTFSNKRDYFSLCLVIETNILFRSIFKNWNRNMGWSNKMIYTPKCVWHLPLRFVAKQQSNWQNFNNLSFDSLRRKIERKPKFCSVHCWHNISIVIEFNLDWSKILKLFTLSSELTIHCACAWIFARLIIAKFFTHTNIELLMNSCPQQTLALTPKCIAIPIVAKEISLNKHCKFYFNTSMVFQK